MPQTKYKSHVIVACMFDEDDEWAKTVGVAFAAQLASRRAREAEQECRMKDLADENRALKSKIEIATLLGLGYVCVAILFLILYFGNIYVY